MRSRALAVLSWCAALIVPTAIGAMLWHLCLRGGPALGLDLFFGDAPPLAALLGQRPVWVEGSVPKKNSNIVFA